MFSKWCALLSYLLSSWQRYSFENARKFMIMHRWQLHLGLLLLPPPTPLPLRLLLIPRSSIYSFKGELFIVEKAKIMLRTARRNPRWYRHDKNVCPRQVVPFCGKVQTIFRQIPRHRHPYTYVRMYIHT